MFHDLGVHQFGFGGQHFVDVQVLDLAHLAEGLEASILNADLFDGEGGVQGTHVHGGVVASSICGTASKHKIKIY